MHDTLFPDTAIRLGQLIPNPRRPTEAIGSKPLPLETLPSERLVDKSIYQLGDEKAANIGFSASVLSFLPFELSGERKHQTTHLYKIERMEEKLIVPTVEYVKQSVFQPEVLGYLASMLYKKSLYMVVGIRVAFDATVSHSKKLGHTGGLHATVPGAAMGIPVDLGAGVKGSTDTGFNQRMHLSDGFVFAYRLRKIRYSRRRMVARATDCPRGDLYQFGRSESEVKGGTTLETAKYEGVKDEIDTVGIDDFDFEEDEGDTKVVDGCIIVKNVSA